jgi:hypothetical protein
MVESSYKTSTTAGNFGQFGIDVVYRIKNTGQAIGIARLACCRRVFAELDLRRSCRCQPFGNTARSSVAGR